MTGSFLKAVAERALKSAAQAAVLVVGASQFDWVHADWKSIGLSTLAAGGLSVLTSLASIPYGVDGTPSLVGLLASTKPVQSSGGETAPVEPADESTPAGALKFD